jgi:membrane fusion protein, multidrug efflux system
MKTKVISIFLAILILAGSCKNDKKAQEEKIRQGKQKELAQLLKQHDEISDKIRKLQEELSSKQDPGTRVAVTSLQPTVFNHYIEVQGRVDGDKNVTVFAEGLGGMIESILVTEGQAVYAGQVLAKIDDKLYQDNLKANLSNLDFVTAMYNKQKNLWDQKIGSEVQYLDIKSKKEALESAVSAIKEQIDMCLIKAPVGGTVEDIPVKVGQLVGPGVVAFRVINLSSLKVVADLAESYTSRINLGDKVKVYLPDLKKEVEGKIDYSSKFINPTNRTFQVGARFLSFDKELKANMVAVVRINDYKAPDALVVPINMVQSDQTGYYVVLADKTAQGSKAKRVAVTVGETYKGLTEIKSGLKPGDMIITAGYLDLENGQTINF